MAEPTLLYPPSPANVPSDLTAPTPAYRRNAWLALLGLSLFVAVYVGMTFGMGYIVWRTLGQAILHGGRSVVVQVLMSIPAIFFLLFLLRGLFLVRHREDPFLIQVTRGEEPRLFDFLERLADETGAPRPHKVFLAPDVNAAVFYDLSFWNLLVPTKKNLLLGLGLVNVLTLDELKAVVAHEYGHFGQRTMAVGRWVYVAQAIANHIVWGRGVFDRIVLFISSIDIRVAWIGWLARLFLWAIRAVLETLLRGVALAYRALGREMEFQADRVAVTVAGSDSIVHGLVRAGDGDAAWGETMGFFGDELGKGRAVRDLFAVQTACIEHLRRITDDPTFGRKPKAGQALVFESQLAQPPKMWMTHPPNLDREQSAKAHYVASPIDERSAWELFAHPGTTRERVTAHFIEQARKPKDPNAPAPKALEVPPIEKSLADLEEKFVRPSLEPELRGTHQGRAIALHHSMAMNLLGEGLELDETTLRKVLEDPYPVSLRAQLKSYREERQEEAMLLGLKAGRLDPQEGVILYRGMEVPRARLDEIVEVAKKTREATEAELVRGDQLRRAAHQEAARFLGKGWDAYHASLVELLHYASHVCRELADAMGHLDHTLGVVFADGRVSDAERQKVHILALELQALLEQTWKQVKLVSLPDAVRVRFEQEGGFRTLKQDLGARDPSLPVLGDWLGVVHGWAMGAADDLQVLSNETLDTLLVTEASLRTHFLGGTDPGEAPSAATVPSGYPVRPIGKERPRDAKLTWWDRFQMADGWLAGTARFVVAAGLLLPVFFVMDLTRSTRVHVHNGLDVPVMVRVGSQRFEVPAHRTTHEPLTASGEVQVEATTWPEGRLVERFEASVDTDFGDLVYNVASASALMEVHATYGAISAPANRLLGTPRWFIAEEDSVLTRPPHQVASSGPTTRSALMALDEPFDDAPPPVAALASALPEKDRQALAAAHLRFADDAHLAAELFGVIPNELARVIASERPPSILTERALQDLGQRDAARCASLSQRFSGADLVYLEARCLPEDSAEQDAAFLAGSAAHPEHPWLSFAAGIVHFEQGRPELALSILEGSAGLPGSVGEYAVETRARIARQVRALGREDVIVPRPAALVPRLDLEPGLPDTSDPQWRPYQLLAAGRLEEARTAMRSQGDSARFDVLLACSDGAPEDAVVRVMSFDPAMLGPAERMLLAALAHRRQVEAPFAASLAEGPFGQVPQAFADPIALEALASGFAPLERGLVLAAGVVAVGSDPAMPRSWRTDARSLLFADERPYFTP